VENNSKKSSSPKTEAQWRSEVKALHKAVATLQSIVKVQRERLSRYEKTGKLSKFDHRFLGGINVIW
jgi:hypothetical protein